MRQSVKVEQLQELDFKKQKTLATLFGQFGNCVRLDNDGNEYLNLGILSERINIGRMLEALDRDWFLELNPPGMDSLYNFQLKIIERKDCKDSMDYAYEEKYFSNELCDVLFEAVTEQYLSA